MANPIDVSPIDVTCIQRLREQFLAFMFRAKKRIIVNKGKKSTYLFIGRAIKSFIVNICYLKPTRISRRTASVWSALLNYLLSLFANHQSKRRRWISQKHFQSLCKNFFHPMRHKFRPSLSFHFFSQQTCSRLLHLCPPQRHLLLAR